MDYAHAYRLMEESLTRITAADWPQTATEEGDTHG